MTAQAIIFARGKDYERQIELCEAHAARMGYNVAGVIMGDPKGIGRTIKASGLHIDRVIIADRARISRNARDLFLIENELEVIYGVTLERAGQ